MRTVPLLVAHTQSSVTLEKILSPIHCSDIEDKESSAHECRLCCESARDGDKIQRRSSHVFLALLMNWKSWIQKKVIFFHCLLSLVQ